MPDLETVRTVLSRHAANKRQLARESGLSLSTVKNLCQYPEAVRDKRIWRTLLDTATRLDGEQTREEELRANVASSATRELAGVGENDDD